MDRVYEELDDAKAEIEKLKADYRIKAELSESLKRAHDEQLKKTRDLCVKIDKRTDELNEKVEEISTVKQSYEDIKCRLNEKEGIVKNLSYANEKLRADCTSKVKILEEENRQLAVTLDEASGKIIDQEQKVRALKEEIEGLKGMLSASRRKCSEVEEKVKAPVELRRRDDMLLTLEEEHDKVKDQLKWKKEQFKHLEDAHENLRKQFHASKKDWELEKSKLIDELCSLQTSLESQTRISEDLQSRLMMCNQALAHEESRRKRLEVQLSESKTCFENVFSECKEAKLKIENLTLKRDEEIAALRNSLGTKGTLYKESEHKVRSLEQENQDLHASLKELQEAQIHEAKSYSSLGKLKNKLKSLEQLHKGCSINLRAKEEEWCSQMGKLSGNLEDCKSEIKSKDAAIDELKMELDSCHSLLMQMKLQNEESSLVSLVLKSAFSEVISKLNAEKASMDSHEKEREQHISLLLKQLELNDCSLKKAQMAIDEESKKSASLLRRAEAMDVSEQQALLLKVELEQHKEMLKELPSHQLHLKNQALQMESEFESKLREVCDALDAANSELADRISEGNEMEFELKVWKSIAERLKADLKENHGKCREIEASLLAQAEVEEALNRQNDILIHALDEKERIIGVLNQELEKTRKEMRSIVESKAIEEGGNQQMEIEKKLESSIPAQIDADKSFKLEKEDLLRVVEEKDEKVNHLEQLVKSLEENSCSFRSQLEQKHAEVDSVYEAWQEMATAEALKKEEIEEKNTMIGELMNDISSLKQKVEKIKSDLEEKQLEVRELTHQLETKLRTSDASVNRLENEKAKLLESLKKLSVERENMLGFLWDLGDKIGKFSGEDMELMKMLARIVETCNNESVDMDLEENDDELYPPIKENGGPQFSPAIKKSVDTAAYERSPFRELND